MSLLDLGVHIRARRPCATGSGFVRGIILLFEQPIRVGDVVSVDDTTGTVSRLRIRATTITN